MMEYNFIARLSKPLQLFLLSGMLFLSHTPGVAQAKKEKPQSPVSVDEGGRLVYAMDELGNRIPDFSYSGYMAGESVIPDAPVKVVVPVIPGDATHRIQAAIDYVASLPADKNGVRGAVLLEKGVHEVEGSLKIHSSGVVLRGSGMLENGTVLLGAGKTRDTLIKLQGKKDRQIKLTARITDLYVPVNALTFKVNDPKAFKPGDMVMIHRPSTEEWIEELGTGHFGGGITALGWKPGQYDIYWDRKIVAVDEKNITIDAPITTALDQKFGGGYLIAYHWPGRISHSGVENLTLRSAYDKANPKDEEHRWMAITMENISDAWVRQVVFEHFAGSAVAVLESAKRVTVEDCKSLNPVSEIGGQRRITFYTSGQQTLFQRLYAEYGYHDFAVGYCAAGPNAFVQCDSYLPYSFSGALEGWASGILLDVVNVDGQALGFSNRGQDGHGAGWTAANSVLWQCTASKINCYRPPTAQNWSFGSWAQFSGNGHWENSNNHIKPRSLYYAQLENRLNKDLSSVAHLLEVKTSGTTSPTLEQAAFLTQAAAEPMPVLSNWIMDVARKRVIPVQAEGVKTIDQIANKKVGVQKTAASSSAIPAVSIKNGLLMEDNKILIGSRKGVRWWSGSTRPDAVEKATPHITRYVPGRTGTGLTDDLQEVTEWMVRENIVGLEHNYGLWYDRRRDDHERIRRSDGEAWPPFYELPFARSGQGTAWDGLSKYDLKKYNNWYWHRLSEFANLAEQNGRILIHHHYFQHNILEAGAHWSDSPWRPANNINDTGFPEPPPYAGDKRIFMAEQFYDLSNENRRELHRAYIRKCLDNFADNSNVIQLVSEEYTGPLHFVEFWIDVIMEWEKETGKKAIIGLSTTKDVQDAILKDPVRSTAVDVIDIRYWHYRDDGSVYAPGGGLNLAPRQFARIMSTGKQSFDQVYRAVYEYRQQHPDKAVIYSCHGAESHAWAIFMGGGSLPAIPKIQNSRFLEEASSMQVINLPGNPEKQWTLGDHDRGYIIYADSEEPVNLDLSHSKGSFKVYRVNPSDGSLTRDSVPVKAGSSVQIKKSRQGAEVIWLSRK